MRTRNGTFLAAKFTEDNNTLCHNIYAFKSRIFILSFLIFGDFNRWRGRSPVKKADRTFLNVHNE